MEQKPLENQKALDDKKVLYVLRTLYRVVKKSGKRGKQPFALIDPFSVTFNAKGKIACRYAGETTDMAEALKRVGVAVYQIFAGVSEFNDESYVVDGYAGRPLRSACWPNVAYLLSGQANDFQLVEKMIGWKSNWRLWLDARRDRINAKINVGRREMKERQLTRQQKMTEQERQLAMAGSKRGLADLYLMLNKLFFAHAKAGFWILTALMYSAAIGVFWLINTGVAATLVLAIFCLVFVLLAGIEAYLQSLFILHRLVHFGMVGLLVIFFLGSSSYTFSVSLPLAVGKNRNLVLLERDNNAMVARLPNNDNDEFLTWRETAIPLLRYRIEAGLPLTAKQNFTLVFGDKELKFSAAFKIDAIYALIDETSAAYTLAWDYWRKPENLTTAVQEIFDRIKEETRVEFEKEIAQYKSGEKKFGAREAKALFKKLNKKIRFYFRAYMGNLFCYDLIMAFTDTPYYNFEEARWPRVMVDRGTGVDIAAESDTDVPSEQ